MELEIAEYQNLLKRISDTYTQGHIRVIQAIHVEITQTYWLVGQHIRRYRLLGFTKFFCVYDSMFNAQNVISDNIYC